MRAVAWALLLMLLAPALGGGCATPRLSQAIPPTGLGGGEDRRVRLLPVRDGRPPAQRCARASDADAPCSPEATTWLTELLERQMVLAGLRVEVGGDGEPGELVLRPALLRLKAGPALADLHLEVRATSASGLEARRSFFARGTGYGEREGRVPPQVPIDSAAKQLSRSFVAGVLSLLNAHPGLGRAG